MSAALDAFYTERGVASKALDSLAEANASIHLLNRNVGLWKAAVAERDAKIVDQAARIAELELALAQQAACSAGLDAYLTAFKVAHKGSPVLADSGKRFKDGRIKTVGRIAYEKAHDADATSIPGFKLAREN